MACSTEQIALTEARRTFSRAADDVMDNTLFFTGSILATSGSGGGILLALAKRSPLGLTLSAAMFAGSFLGMLASENNFEQAIEDYKIAKENYDQAKDAYCTCILSSLPPDTG
jgi:hypothetical protein